MECHQRQLQLLRRLLLPLRLARFPLQERRAHCSSNSSSKRRPRKRSWLRFKPS
jgi:hypothetical protein